MRYDDDKRVWFSGRRMNLAGQLGVCALLLRRLRSRDAKVLYVRPTYVKMNGRRR